ncbi:hypothetical protein HWV62_22104 [Athelia sp. TMB]|nr:hypothetical protein HWV62_22104 [Athelia sp. TMB]
MQRLLDAFARKARPAATEAAGAALLGNASGASERTDKVPGPVVVTEEKVAHPVFNTAGTSGGSVYNFVGDCLSQGSEELVSRVVQTLVLQQLPYAKGASWDETRTCLPGTRASVLAAIDVWAHSRDAQNIFWLNGVAGSGKSAIAHTAARTLREAGVLTAAFFFSRDAAARNNPQSLFSTLARDLATLHSGIADDIAAALEREPALASASLSRQFRALILEPCAHHPLDRPIVVVIDALDESMQKDRDTSLLAIFRDAVPELPPQFRILLTSRPTAEIAQFLSGRAHVAPYSLDIHSRENKDDIALFVRAQLCGDMVRASVGPDWPGDDALRALARRSGGLFVWIATICVYLRTVYHPRKKLRALLAKSPQEGFAPDKTMDSLYATVLAACGEWDDADFVEDYGLVMGAIMAAKRPLSLTALRALHESIQELSPGDLLARFGSVLVGFRDPDQPIRILHLSFREFITDRAANGDGTRQFYISEAAHSSRLAVTCLKFLNSELRNTAGISGIGYLSMPSENFPGIPEISGISERTLYCCEHWIDHLVDVEDPNKISEDVSIFISEHLTSWLEIVASKSTFRGLLVLRRWLQNNAPTLQPLFNNRSQALILRSLADRLSHAHRLEEALLATQELVDLRRALVAAQPADAALRAELAASLNDISHRFSDLGRRMEGQAATQEAASVTQLAMPRAYNLAEQSDDWILQVLRAMFFLFKWAPIIACY